MFKKVISQVHYILVSTSPCGDVETSKKTILHNSKKKCSPAHKQLSMILRIWTVPWRCLSERTLDELKTYSARHCTEELRKLCQQGGRWKWRGANLRKEAAWTGRRRKQSSTDWSLFAFFHHCPCCERKMQNQFYTANTNLCLSFCQLGMCSSTQVPIYKT